MPFYEYRCPICGSRFELLRNISQRDSPAECPECGALTHTRLLSVPMAFSLTGDGTVQMIGGGSPCGGCIATSCAGCGIRS